MEINHITNHIKNGVEESDTSYKSGKAGGKGADSSNDPDRVSLELPRSQKSDRLFARLELEKLNHSSFEKLKVMKAKLSDYEAAKVNSPEEAEKTEIGKMLNDPGIWSRIAEKIV